VLLNASLVILWDSLDLITICCRNDPLLFVLCTNRTNWTHKEEVAYIRLQEYYISETNERISIVVGTEGVTKS
jgi:hypothetical protein